MERTDIAYLVNSTPKYFYLLPLHFMLLKRYAPSLAWPLYVASEVPDHPILKVLEEEYGVQILPLDSSESGFLESRTAAIQKLPATIQYVLPMQEDFLLERFVDTAEVQRSVHLLDTNPFVGSIRWMPCPGPEVKTPFVEKYATITEKDTYKYIFQATLWRRSVVQEWFTKLVEQFNKEYPQTLSMRERMYFQIRINYAENQKGQDMFWKWFGNLQHLAWIRKHKAPNAVYMSPWPYRPTAVTNGKLEAWAVEMAKREGYVLSPTEFL
jgi:hypothetical protein